MGNAIRGDFVNEITLYMKHLAIEDLLHKKAEFNF